MRVALSVRTLISGLAVLAVLVSVHAATAADEPGPVIVTLDTAAGEIDVAVFTGRAPLSAADFLRYVERGLYDGGAFYRAVRAENDHGTPKIAVIQGGLVDESKALPPVAHETTRDTGITHRDGTVSLARGAPGTGSGGAFFICIGDQPALDFGGTRNPDGQGFAAFGRVVRGMDVVRKIHAMPAAAPSPSEYMAGQLLSEPVAIRRAYQRATPAVVAELNHLYVTLRKETVDAIASSQFVRERFGIVETRTVNAGTASWTGTYLLGWTSYLELFAPGGAEGFTEGSSGIGFSVPRLGSGAFVWKRLATVPGEDATSSLRSLQVDERTSVPWFEAIGLKSLESTAFTAWLMDFRPEYVGHRKVARADASVVERHAYMAAKFTAPEQREALEKVAFDDLLEIRLELAAAEAASFAHFANGLGWSSAIDGAWQIQRAGTFAIVVTTVPSPSYRIRTVVCSLRRDAGPAVEHAFGPDARFRLEGRTATWTFGPR
jgi:peptidyl-prolyl cis-trans isomerase A (cyclophilin A)